VYPGDVVELETYAYYENFTANGTLGSTALIAGIAGAFGGVNGGTEGQQMMFNVVNDALVLFGFLGDNNSTEPQAYLNYILFDEAMQPADFGFAGVTTAANLNQELLQLQVNVSKSGYLFIYTSNESNSTDPVYFDDLKVTLHPGKVDAAYDYYPFGLPTAESWERVTAPVVDRKYQGQFAYWEKETNLSRFKARIYDAAIGRWLSTDPANQYNSPYLGMGNSPLKGMDKDGAFFGIDDFYLRFTKSIIDGHSFKTSVDRGWNQMENSSRIALGLFKTDRTRTDFGQFLQLLSRFTWEADQTFWGHTISQVRNTFGEVDNVEYYRGVTLVNENKPDGGWGMTVGTFINSVNMRADPYTDDLFRHEFGHTLQSRLLGPAYMGRVGFFSFVGGFLDNDVGIHNHDNEWNETQANRMAFRYFDNHDPNSLLHDPASGRGIEWNNSEYPREYEPQWYAIFNSPPIPFIWGLFF
jgi:RHS repeat-associated protein